MKKSISNEILPSLMIKQYGDSLLIQIYLNRKEIETDEGGIQYEYDFNEIHAPVGHLNSELLNENPKAFLNFDYAEHIEKIAAVQAELAEYDYIGVKIAMGKATRADYEKEIAYTEILRQRIRELRKYATEYVQ